MLDLKPIEISDKPWADPFIFQEDSRSADYNFGNVFLWDERYQQRLCRFGGRLIVMACYSHHPFFAWPVGGGELAPVIEELRGTAAALGFPFTIRGVTNEGEALLEELFPGKFSFSHDRDFFDYIYTVEKLANLTGKKLHAKRNHINRFQESNAWSYEPLTPALLGECAALLDEWMELAGEEIDESLRAEHTAIRKAFAHYEALGLVGGLLRVSGRAVAFTIGERICSDTIDVHFEKALAEVDGAYPMINREFARHVMSAWPEIKYLNREDDMGKDNLRQTKLSYLPDILLEKHTATWTE